MSQYLRLIGEGEFRVIPFIASLFRNSVQIYDKSAKETNFGTTITEYFHLNSLWQHRIY
jgi:hypothetical protein